MPRSGFKWHQWRTGRHPHSRQAAELAMRFPIQPRRSFSTPTKCVFPCGFELTGCSLGWVLNPATSRPELDFMRVVYSASARDRSRLFGRAEWAATQPISATEADGWQQLSRVCQNRAAVQRCHRTPYAAGILCYIEALSGIICNWPG